MSILRNGEWYDAQHRYLTAEDIDFYVGQAVKASGPVLEICCGTGRITIPTAEAGVDITGLELEPAMLDRARTKAEEKGVRIDWICGDATTFSLGRKFNLVTAPFNSLQLFGTTSKTLDCLKRVKESLLPEGCFVFDVFNPNLEYLAPHDSAARRKAAVFQSPETGEDVNVEWSNVYNQETQITDVKLYYSTKDKKDFAVDNVRQRCFFPQELNLLVEHVGFKILEKFGDFSGKRFSNGDSKQVVVCTRI